MDFQNGDNQERRVIRKTTVLNPPNQLLQPKFQVASRRCSTRKIIRLTTDNLMPHKPRPSKNTVKTKCVKLNYCDLSRGGARSIIKKNKSHNARKPTSKMFKDTKTTVVTSNLQNNCDMNEMKTSGDNILLIDPCIQNSSVAEQIINNSAIENISNYTIDKPIKTTSAKVIKKPFLQNTDTKTKNGAPTTNNTSSKKTAQTLRYMKKQRYIRKQELKNEFLTKELIKERRKTCLENLQLMSKKILHNNITNKSRKNILPQSVKAKLTTQSQEISNRVDLPASYAINKDHSPPSGKVLLHDRVAIDRVDGPLPDHNNLVTILSFDEQNDKEVNSNKKRIKLDKSSIHHTGPFSSYTNNHSEKKKKTEFDSSFDASTLYLSSKYPYNLIAAVENKLSMNLKSNNDLSSEPHMNIKDTIINPSMNESNKIQNHFLYEIESICGVTNIHDMCSSSKTEILNLTEKYKKNKSWNKSFDNKKNSFYGVKKVIKNKSPLSSNKNFFNQIQSSLTNFNNSNLSLEDILGSNNSEPNNLKEIPEDTLVVAYNTITPIVEAKEYLEESLSATGNLLTEPKLNHALSERSNDGVTKPMTKTNNSMNQINSSFRNELSLLHSFNESLRHIQMVEDTLTSIRKSDENLFATKVLNVPLEVPLTKSKLQAKTDKMENEKSMLHVINSSPMNSVITKFNVFSDTSTSYSPSARSKNNYCDGIRSERNSLSFSEEDKRGERNVTSRMSIEKDAFKDVGAFNTLGAHTAPHSINIDSSELKHSSISQVDKTSESDAQNKMLKSENDHESAENSACDSNVETGVEQMLPDTSFSIKSSNNSKNYNPHMLSHMNRFCVFMMSQYVEDEKVRSEYLDLFLRVREKTLMDATRSEILLLEVQKKYSQEQIPYLKKKQRGLLVKLQQERNEIRNIKKFQHEQSNERKEAIKRQLKYFKTIFTSDTSGKDIKKSVNRSNLLVQSKSIARNSPIKAFSLSLSTDSNSHDSSLIQINEIIQKKKATLAKQKKIMNELLLSHYDLQMDAAEIKAMGDRINDSKRLPLRDFSDLRKTIDRALQDNKFSVTQQITNMSDAKEVGERDVTSPILIQKHLEESKPRDNISNHPNAGVINIPNSFGIIPSLNLSNISIVPKSADSKEKQKFNNEFNLEASSISLNIMSIPNSNESPSTEKCYGLVNGSNLNLLWRKITGEEVDKYNNSNYYEMSEEKLDSFFEGAKHVAFQNLLRLDKAKNETKTAHVSSEDADDHTINEELVETKEQHIDNILKPIPSLSNEIHYFSKRDMTLPSRSESRKNFSRSNSTNFPAENVADSKKNLKELLPNHYENIVTSSDSKFLSVATSNMAQFNDGSINNPDKDTSDQSDSSESTARSLIDELEQFHNLDNMNSSYADTCDKSSTLQTSDSVLLSNNDVANDTAAQYPEDENRNTSIENKSVPNVSMACIEPNQSTQDAHPCITDDVIINELNCNDRDESEIIKITHADAANETASIIDLNKNKDDFTHETRNDFNEKLDANRVLNVIEWNNSQELNNVTVIQPISTEKYKSNDGLVHKQNIENVSFQSDCRMLNQLVNDSNNFQDIMSKQNMNSKEENLLTHESSQNEISNDEVVNIDKSCNDLDKTDENNDNKNARNHDHLSNTWDLMSSSPEPSPRDSPTGEYSPATAAFSVSLSRIDEELRKKQLAIELEIKALEQQQTQLPYCLVREIPDKPPPPYIPPVEENKSSVTSPKDSVTIGKPIIQVSTAIKSTCSWLWSQYNSENTTNINYSNFDADINLSKDKQYSIFLFDLCRETFEKEISIRKSPQFIWEYKKVKLLRPGKTDICLVVENKVKKFLGLEIWPIKKNLITNWAQKRQDYINELLLKELYKEEVNWANVEEAESEVKNNITDTILESLLLEVCKEFKDMY